MPSLTHVRCAAYGLAPWLRHSQPFGFSWLRTKKSLQWKIQQGLQCKFQSLHCKPSVNCIYFKIIKLLYKLKQIGNFEPKKEEIDRLSHAPEASNSSFLNLLDFPPNALPLVANAPSAVAPGRPLSQAKGDSQAHQNRASPHGFEERYFFEYGIYFKN